MGIGKIMSYFTYAFEAPILHYSIGRYNYNVVFLPSDLQESLPFSEHPRLRIDAEVGEFPLEGAWQPAKGRWYLMLPRQFMKEGKLSLGDIVEVRFCIADQDAVNVPDALRLALAANEQAAIAIAWEQITSGRRRGFAHRVASARTVATRNRRVAEVLKALIKIQ